MRFLGIISMLFIFACEGEKNFAESSTQDRPTKGYDAYIFACTTDGESEESCSCQADVLARNLTDEEIYILTEAGVAAYSGDTEKVNYVMENHPSIILAMKNLSIDAEICFVAANTELENFAEQITFPIMEHKDSTTWYGTTILCVRKDNKVVIAGDGQVSIGHTVMKSKARKIRRIGEDDQIIAGFAGATADAFTLFERLEAKLEKHPGQLMRACVELAKDWRMDKYLRRLEAMMAVADKDVSLILTGNGDVLEPEDGMIGIGSGGNYALSAARALADSKLDATKIVEKSMKIAADICVYTNENIIIEEIELNK